MAKSNATFQRGFTLIEMSIVLVIIGLIVGGILKGQELIESSRQKNLISQIDRIRSGTTAFVDRFRSLPGDLGRISILPNASLIGATSGGNDNGVVGAVAANVNTALISTINDTENVQFFNHMVVANLASAGAATPRAVTLGCFAGYCATPSPLPAAAFPQSGVTITYGTHPGGTNGAASGQEDEREAHWLLVSRWSGAAPAAADAVIPAARAYQLDSKYDDGGAGSGNMRTAFTGSGTAASCGTATTDYAATDTASLCHLWFTLQ
jgi:prepilin-type N-terminal cleavage/methylation domain-containing protein